jgi:hypothetical protein
MLLTMDDWNSIRENFSEEEKAALNAAIQGEVLCPRGCIVNESLAGPVALKVKELLERKP